MENKNELEKLKVENEKLKELLRVFVEKLTGIYKNDNDK